MRRITSVTFGLLILACLSCSSGAETAPGEIVRDVPPGFPSVHSITSLTNGTAHHFVGYYGITPWNAEGSSLFCLESEVGDRLIEAADRANVCLIDLKTHAIRRIAQTSAWNLQQGAMLHWLPTAPDRELVYNDRIDGKLVSVVFDVQDNRRVRVIDRPIAAISPDGKLAIGLNYDRLRQIRPVTGYAGGLTSEPVINRPNDDGLFIIDVKTGTSRLLVSVEAACRVLPPPEQLADQPFWLEHALFNRDGSRVFFLARTYELKSRRLTSVPLVMKSDGTELRALMPWAVQGASHFDWLDDRHIAITRQHAPDQWHHLLFDASQPDAPPKKLAPDVLTRDGHCSFSPDGRWMVTDTYPDENRRQHLYVMDMKAGKAARIASFSSPPAYRADWRCDLHPRWSRDSKQVCIDSVHEDKRRVYVLDLNIPAD